MQADETEVHANDAAAAAAETSSSQLGKSETMDGAKLLNLFDPE